MELLSNIRPEIMDSERDAHRCPESVVNKLISTVYSGPTISDIESALSVTCQKDAESSDGRCPWRPIDCSPEKGPMGKIENKYTLRIKTCGKDLDDGYKWRKYGQKYIRNNHNARSYYRCTNPRCNAKKQVEKSTEDPDILIVTYEGLHLHYTYSQFLASRPQDFPTAGGHTRKKPKRYYMSQQDEIPDNTLLEAPTKSPSILMPQQEASCHEAESSTRDQSHVIVEDGSQPRSFDGALQSSQGLLEDVVPLVVRKPCNSMTIPNDHYPSSHATSSYYPTFSWTPFSSEVNANQE